MDELFFAATSAGFLRRNGTLCCSCCSILTKVTTDIDIDFADRDAALQGLMHVPASMEGRSGETYGEHRRHPTGAYFQNIPTDPLSTYSSLTYEEAADRGYFKIDFLNNSIYNGVRDEDHLIELLEREPPWDFFEEEAIVGMLAHIHNAFGTVQQIRPRSIEDLAVILALQRPGKKALLLSSREEIDANIWTPNKDGFVFKRAHAIAYAASIVVQLNLIVEKMSEELA